MSRDAIVWMLAGAFTVGAVRLSVAVVQAVWRLWRAHEEAKEQESERRRLLEVAHRTPAPFQQKASQGFEKNRRAS